MKRTDLFAATAAALSLSLVLSACAGPKAPASSSQSSAPAGSSQTSSSISADQAAADQAAALIDAIYVQQRTPETDAQCKAAKAAWDALTDVQKELVSGQHADPDYFGRDTGDGSLDDPRNGDSIGEKELLVVSFGTSFNDSRVSDIKAVEDYLQARFPEWSVRRAFTSQIIINHIQAREGYAIDNVQQALDRAVASGVQELVVQPTLLMPGAEYDEMMEVLEGYKDKFQRVAVAQPLLGETGVNAYKADVAQAVVETAARDAGFDSAAAAAEQGTAIVLLGHGTSHQAKVTYSQMQQILTEQGFGNAFVGTVEGEPEDTACQAVIDKVKDAGYKQVVLRPLMVVAGDHAHNDMAGEDADSWMSMFRAAGSFDEVSAQLAGLGAVQAVQTIYGDHAQDAIAALAQ